VEIAGDIDVGSAAGETLDRLDVAPLGGEKDRGVLRIEPARGQRGRQGDRSGE